MTNFKFLVFNYLSIIFGINCFLNYFTRTKYQDKDSKASNVIINEKIIYSKNYHNLDIEEKKDLLDPSLWDENWV